LPPGEITATSVENRDLIPGPGVQHNESDPPRQRLGDRTESKRRHYRACPRAVQRPLPQNGNARRLHTLSIDGSTGEVFLGEVAVRPSPVVRYFEGTMSVDEGGPVVAAVDRLMTVADKHRRMRVRANADIAPDAARARRFGAEGIGLCRTEHMFLGARRELVERLILAEGAQDRQVVFDELLPLQRAASASSCPSERRSCR
jgi:hypothetical protein